MLSRASNDYNMEVGKLLVQKQIITDNQLQKALKLQKDKLLHRGTPAYIGKVIVEMGLASENQIVQAINAHYRLSISSLSENVEALVRSKRKKLRDRVPAPAVPIWLKLSVASAFIIILTIVSLSIVILKQQWEQLYQQTIKIGMVSLNYFVNNSRIPLIEDNTLRLNTLIREAKEVEGIKYAIIVDQNRQIKAHTDHTQIDTRYEPNKNTSHMEKRGNIDYYTFISADGQRILNLSRTVTFKDKTLGEVHVGVSLDFIHHLFHEKRSLIIGVASAILFFGVMISVLMGINFSKPMKTLVNATKQIAGGNYHHRVEMHRKDELGSLADAFNQMSRELWRKSLMEKSFGKYVGSDVLEMILADPENPWLKGRRTEATVLFTDIRGFTSYSEIKEPEEVVESLNDYFEIATKVILDNGGYVDKFVGDAVLGVFGVPVFHENHMERAVLAALEMQRVFIKKADDNKNRLLASVGIGINSGVVVSGNIGSQVKMEYTVIGDTVNVASRLNGLAGSGEIIISKPIYLALRDRLIVEPRPPQNIKGKLEPIDIFRVLDLADFQKAI